MALNDEHAREYLNEAKLTLDGARASFEKAKSAGKPLWANVVKNAYDAIEQAVSSALAKKGLAIPKEHPDKVRRFIDDYSLEQSEISELLLRWMWKRSRAQYVDFRKGRLLVPHLLFDEGDAMEILKDAEKIIEFIEKLVS